MIAYLDTSVLMRLVIEEPGSPRARGVWDGADLLFANRLLMVEAAAALAAARRAGRVTVREHDAALDDLDRMWACIEVVEVDAGVMRSGMRLAARHSLRGYDAAHLACAVVVGADAFVTADQRLARAAAAEGMHVAELGDSRGQDAPQ